MLVTGVTAEALAATTVSPKKGAKFTGSVTATPVNGFTPQVSFKVSSDGKSVTGFSFGDAGCQSSGGFKPGVNPLKPIKFSKLTIKSAKFSGTASASFFNVVYRAKVTGTFKTAKSVSGTVQVGQKAKGGCAGPIELYSAKTK